MPYSSQAFAFESLLTSTKMTQMMDNDEQLKASIIGSHEGFSFVDSGHTHDNSNSAFIEALGNNTVDQANINASAVGRAELKSTTGEVSTSAAGTAVLPGGEYGFYPQIKKDAGATGGTWFLVNSYGGSTSYETRIFLQRNGGSDLVYAQQRYIQASPPYKIGDTFWGHFIFTLRDKDTQEVLFAYQAEDPPWAYNGFGPKDSPERISSVPHPFCEYRDEDIPKNLEITLFNLNDVNINLWREEIEKKGGSILGNLNKLKISHIQTFSNFNLPSAIHGFSDKVVIREARWR